MPEHITDINEILEYLMRPSGVMRRRVMLKKGWSGDASGAMLGRLVSGESVALLPGVYGGYYYREPRSGKRIRVSRKTEGFIEEEAVVFYKPFPLRPMGGKDLLSYIFRLMRKRDYVLVFALAAAAAGIGMLIPWSAEDFTLMYWYMEALRFCAPWSRLWRASRWRKC